MNSSLNKKTAGGHPAALLNKQIDFNKSGPSEQRKKLDRSTFPDPADVLLWLDVRSARKGDWLIARCPFHANGQERHPSLNVHAKEGYYRCHACGAKGPDMIAFYQAVMNCGFGEAVKAWGVKYV